MIYKITTNGYGMTVTNGENTIEFPTKKAYPKNSFKPDVFDASNIYLATLPQENRNKMFALLSTFSQDVGLGVTIPSIHSTIEEFYRLLLVETHLTEWVKTVPIPDKIGVDIDEGVNHTVNKTYVTHEYKDLMVCVIVMKILVPYVYTITGMLTVNQTFKPIEMVKYLPKPLFKLPWERKFASYIDTFVDLSDGKMDKVVNAGLDDDNVFPWIYGLVLLNKLISAPVFNSNNGSHVITHCHSYIKGKLTPRIAAITSKSLGNSATNEQADSESDFQAYRSKDTLSIAHQVEIEHTVSQKYLGGTMLRSYIPVNKHARYKRLCNALSRNKLEITDEMVLICNWVISDIVHVKVFDVLKSDKLYPVIAFVHLLLEDRHPYVAAFLLTNVENNSRGVSITSTSQMGNMKLTPTHVKRLCAMFPIHVNKGNITKETMVAKLAGILNSVTMMRRKIIVQSTCMVAGTKNYVTKEGALKPTANKRTMVADLLLDLDNLLINTMELPKL